MEINWIEMEWFQYVTIMFAIISATFALYKSMKAETASFRESIHRMDNKFLAMEEKFETRFLNIENRFIAMDEKWERLFERLVVQDRRDKV